MVDVVSLDDSDVLFDAFPEDPADDPDVDEFVASFDDPDVDPDVVPVDDEVSLDAAPVEYMIVTFVKD